MAAERAEAGNHDADEPQLMAPELRRIVLDQEIEVLLKSGFRVDARTDHHVAMSTCMPHRRRVQIFVDEFGEAYSY